MDLRSASRGALVGRVGMDLSARRGSRGCDEVGGLAAMVSPTQIRTDGERREPRGQSTGVAAQPDIYDLLLAHPSTVMRGDGAPGSPLGGDTRGSGATRLPPSGECNRVLEQR